MRCIEKGLFTPFSQMSSHPHVLAPLQPSTQGGVSDEDYEFADEPHFAEDQSVRVVMFTRSLGHYLAEMIRKERAELDKQQCDLYVVGTIAWATDEEIMSVLGKHAAGVCVVVNKEKWLRESTFRALKPIALSTLFLAEGILPPNYSHDWSLPAWCAGAINVENNIQFPRMHRKDLVFCARRRPSGDVVGSSLEPYAVWCGSYNLTRTARLSVESATLTWSRVLARHAYRAFLEVLAHAEPLGSVAPTSSPVLVNGS